MGLGRLQLNGISVSMVILIAISFSFCPFSKGAGGKMIEAASRGNIKRVKLLIEEGADVNARDEDGSTALIEAARYEHTEIAKLLIENGADVNAKDKDGWTALMGVAKTGETAKLLIEHGADVNAKDNDGMTALKWAAFEGECELARLLIENGANVNERSKFNWIALIRAVLQTDFEKAKNILSRAMDDDPVVEKRSSWTALIWALKRRKPDTARLLIDHGADVNIA